MYEGLGHGHDQQSILVLAKTSIYEFSTSLLLNVASSDFYKNLLLENAHNYQLGIIIMKFVHMLTFLAVHIPFCC